MCFSATASFITGGVLTVVGAVTLKRAVHTAGLPFAAIPLLFGIQQLVEGVIWLSVPYETMQVRTLATYIYTIFSHVLWPIYIPVAIALIEREPWRRKIMWGFSAIGIVIGVLLAVLIATQPLTVVVGEHLIYVVTHHYEWPMMILYITVTCLAPLCSSYWLIRLLGGLALLMFIVTYWFYSVALFSVWCFFAAILSTIIYLFFSSKRALPVAE